MTINKYNLAEMQLLITGLAQKLKPGDVVCLFGDLGVGKTTFIKALIKEITGIDTATSPTFNIMQVYTTENNKQIYHFDLYRIQDKSELNFIGLHEALGTDITIIEWPEIALNLLPKNSIKIYIDFDEEDDEKRIISILYGYAKKSYKR